MRKLEGIVKKKYNVVIIDHVGSEWLEYCIPKECTSFIVKIRNALPYVKSFSFLYNLFRCIIKSGVTSTSLLSAIILELKPEVVITFIDNNRFMGSIQTIFPDILIISTQNGVRLNDPSFESRGKYFSFPHYFGFGSHELNLMKSKNADVKKYYSKGSLKMGIFLSNLYRPIQKDSNIKNICFISQYRERWADPDDLMLSKLILSYQNICKLLSKFSRENDIEITIVMRSLPNTNDCQDELNFFKRIFGSGGAIYCENNRINMSSYQVGMDSSLIAAFDSTLLFELFGVGKKALFCGSVDKELVSMWGNKSQCNALPNEVLLDSWNYDEFKGKIDTLLEMNNDDYINKTKNAREYYMNFNGEYPHQAIHSIIQRRCE